MSSSFVYVLGAGLAIFLIGGLLAGVVQETAPEAEIDGNAIFSEAIGTIGGGSEATERTVFTVDDVVVEDRSPNATEVSGRTVEVSSSVLGSSSDVVEFEAVRPEQAWISFVPTKGAGDQLIIRLNGEQLAVPTLRQGQRVTIPVDELQPGQNTLYFAATDPGFRFWSSPAYTLQNLQVVVNDESNARVVEPFRVYDYEVNGFDRGEVAFSVLSNLGQETVRDEPLQIRVNGKVVAERLPVPRALPYTATFSANRTGLHAGENTISFATAGDSRYPLSSVSATLFFYAGTQQSTVIEEFELGEDAYDRLGEDDGGTVTFFVERVLVERPLTITLTNRSFELTPTAGTNTVTFGQNAVVQGDNTLQLSTDGAYRINQLNVTVAE